MFSSVSNTHVSLHVLPLYLPLVARLALFCTAELCKNLFLESMS